MFFDSPYQKSDKHFGKLMNPWKWIILSTLAITCYMGYREIQSYIVKPEALFVLGGHEKREKFAAELAQKYPDLPIWVSSGSPQHYAKRIFAARGINGERLHLDYQASDTVTNFTTLVDELKAQGIDSVYLITSTNHMTRARIVGEIVFGSHGIVLKPLPVPSESPSEPIGKCIRDGARAILWLATGHTLSLKK
ncbi:MAG: YdcF family protein [Xenococcaceae cyanobacterium MO_167.B27]|nr:YdcF family protein [Xenococcaceae cyanobacterium MO_167.B27]